MNQPFSASKRASTCIDAHVADAPSPAAYDRASAAPSAVADVLELRDYPERREVSW
jgi:hypothetical protein